MIKRQLMVLACIFLSAHGLLAGPISWWNPGDGAWNDPINWSTNRFPTTGDFVTIDGYAHTNVTIYITNDVNVANININYGTLIVDKNATLTCPLILIGTNASLVLSNSSLAGSVTTYNGGKMICSPANYCTLYPITITNNGTLLWNNGDLTLGGNPAVIVNNGLWQVGSSGSMASLGGPAPICVNNGVLLKSGPATTGLYDFNFINLTGGTVDVQGGTLNLKANGTNFFAGTYHAAGGASLQFKAGIWSDAGAAFTGPGAFNFLGNTLNLRTNVPGNLALLGGEIWLTGGTNFQAQGSITNLTLNGATLRGSNTVSGTLWLNGGHLQDQLLVTPAGIVNFPNNPLSKDLSGLSLINLGTINHGDFVSVANLTVSNAGVWNITGDYPLSYGGGNVPNWINAGVLRKSAGTGAATVGLNFVNLSSGLVDAMAGTLRFNLATNGQLGGTFNASGVIEFTGGAWSDAGGIVSGTGVVRQNGATINLQTNIIPKLLLANGTVNITGKNSFQNDGAITNLTLDGATLAGTNVVSGGSLIANGGNLTGQLTVQTNGQLLFASSFSGYLSPLVLTNLGTVTLNNAFVSCGVTTIVNYGLWQFAGDCGLNYGGVGLSVVTNFGMFQKLSGAGTSDCAAIRFANQPNGVVQANSGTLLLPPTATNYAGTLRLNGGTLGGSFILAGGTLEGAGTFNPNNVTGGTISPGLNSAARINFASGLNLNSNVTLAFAGNGPVPGGSYDTLSVTGAVTLANASLQITAMPIVPAGTKFTLIDNDGTDAVGGTFAGLPENSIVTVGAQDFRIHYAAGTGNDVTLVRDGIVTGPKLALQNDVTNSWTLTGSGAIPLTAFTLRASADLQTWTNIGVVTSSVNGTWTFTDTNAWRYARRFYNTTN